MPMFGATAGPVRSGPGWAEQSIAERRRVVAATVARDPDLAEPSCAHHRPQSSRSSATGA